MSQDAFLADWHRWRERRELSLRQPDGWLSLVGLLWLQVGRWRIGHAPGNDLRLPDGPPWLGEIELDAEGKVRFHAQVAGAARIDGTAAATAILRADDDLQPSRIDVGRLRLQLLRRGDALALRVRDPQAEALRRFAGLTYFDPQPHWQRIARWETFPASRALRQHGSDGRERTAPLHGCAHFELEGHRYRLLPFEQSDRHLSFAFADASNGDRTYAAGRFLHTDAPRDGRVVLDFNRAINPPCAFSAFATCPLPPQENRLHSAVTAGELAYPAQGAAHV
ncbi:DUF1684 domain-containing protein [Xanthomonas bundabergensis]|uniref:DUF1684 domain-containing protein n=1 Tax=Xanthomonas bundabergensis TaxID=3160842 RepID=UPI003514A5F7